MFRLYTKLKLYFRSKTPMQTFSLCLLSICIIMMTISALARLCGILWFAADLTLVKEPNRFCQEVITALLLIVELIFVYKILCRATWFICVIISIIETLIGILIGYLTRNLTFSHTITNVFYSICYFIIPPIFVRHWFIIIDIIVLYILELLYCLLFMVGRIGTIDIATYNYVSSVVGAIDYKLFIISIYLFIKYFGGIKLWKTQKRLILRTDLKK